MSLLSSLNKEPFEQSKAMLDGIRFEDNVLAFTAGTYDPVKPGYDECVEEIANIVQGGLWQERAMMEMIIAGYPCLLYGKIDVMKRNWLYDIKFTSNYEVGKYSASIQHVLYMACTGIEKFGYLISDGRSVWREDYFFQPGDFLRLKAELSDMVEAFMRDPELKQAFINNWQAKPDRKAAA